MAYGIFDLFEAVLFMFNAMAILHPKRVLAKSKFD